MNTETAKPPSARAGEPPPAPTQDPPPPPPKPKPPAHHHPRGVHDVNQGRDPEGRRIIVTEQDRQVTYRSDCKGCQHADRERMAAPPEPYDPSATLFLIPESDYDNMVCRAYVQSRWPEAEHVIHCFNADKLSYVKNALVVVISRRGINGKTGPRTKRTKDEEGTFYDAPIPPETYLNEVVESDPIRVDDCVRVTQGTMYAEESADFGELMARIAERCVPFRLAPPNPPDKLYVMRLNS